MSSTTSKAKTEGAKKKTARENTRAIFDAPVKFDGELPVKKRGGRKSNLAPMIEVLRADPGQWYKIASGKKGTVSQTRSRLMKLDAELRVETHAIEGNDDEADCFAMFPAPTA